jgi:hypothetical protein
MGILGSRGGQAILATGFTVLALQAAEAPRTQWKLRELSWIKREPAEAGAPVNAHPARIDAAALKRQLGAIRFKNEAAVEPLFAEDELARLAEPIREALAAAGPGEDLVLLSTERRGGSFLNSPLGLTLRLFVREGALNLIVHDARLDFVDRFRARETLPVFQYGSRKTAGSVVLECPGIALLRPDWLQIPLDKLQAVPKAAAAPAPENAALAAPPATKAPATGVYEEQERRLRALKHLRDENLITEEEYQRKRKEILETL